MTPSAFPEEMAYESQDLADFDTVLSYVENAYASREEQRIIMNAYADTVTNKANLIDGALTDNLRSFPQDRFELDRLMGFFEALNIPAELPHETSSHYKEGLAIGTLTGYLLNSAKEPREFDPRIFTENIPDQRRRELILQKFLPRLQKHFPTDQMDDFLNRHHIERRNGDYIYKGDNPLQTPPGIQKLMENYIGIYQAIQSGYKDERERDFIKLVYQTTIDYGVADLAETYRDLQKNIDTARRYERRLTGFLTGIKATPGEELNAMFSEEALKARDRDYRFGFYFSLFSRFIVEGEKTLGIEGRELIRDIKRLPGFSTKLLSPVFKEDAVSLPEESHSRLRSIEQLLAKRWV